MKNKAFTSLEKALDILSHYDLDSTSFTAKQISNHLGLPLSTTYKYIDVLLKRGFLARKSGSKEFFLGLSIFRLGNIFGAGFELIDVVIPHMRALLKASGETILLTAVQGQEAICLEKMEPQRLIKLSLDRGRTLPLHAGASSRILLAYQDDDFIDTYVKQQGLQGLTKNTITTCSKLLAELKRTRDKGYVATASEVDEGATAVAAPIFDHKGILVAGLTIAGPTERIDDELLTEMIELVKKQAEEISNDLGYYRSSNS